MKTWEVSLPISGVLYAEVETEDEATEDDAIQAAMEQEDLNINMVEEWEIHKQITQGNVCRAVQNEAEARCLDE